MKRAWLIILAGLALACGAYWGSYRAATANCHAMETSKEPELAWLKSEFHLTEAEFTRVSAVHEEYLAGCAERCQRIDEKNAYLKQLLAGTNAITPEIEKVLSDAAQLRAECYKKMLDHFYNVSRTMPPAEGKRYLAWVQEKTIMSDTHRGMRATDPTMQDMHRDGHQ